MGEKLAALKQKGGGNIGNLDGHYLLGRDAEIKGTTALDVTHIATPYDIGIFDISKIAANYITISGNGARGALVYGTDDYVNYKVIKAGWTDSIPIKASTQDCKYIICCGGVTLDTKAANYNIKFTST